MTEDQEPTLLEVGDVAPDFTLASSEGDRIALAEHRGERNVVLIFYPKDDTPGCTRQLCEARDDRRRYAATDTVRYGVNPGSLESHQKFAGKFELDFPLLVDDGAGVARRYGAAKEGGRIVRSVYLIDKQGRVAFRARGYPSTAEILGALE